MIQRIKRAATEELVRFIHAAQVEIARRKHPQGAPRAAKCKRGHDLTLTRRYKANGRSNGCRECTKLQPSERLCAACNHGLPRHEPECYHRNQGGTYDCDCTAYVPKAGI